MSPVALAELDPVTRQRVLEQIPDAEGGTALATVAEQSSVTLGDPTAMTNEQLADMVIEGVKKIRAYLPYIRALKERFDSADRDSTNRLKTPIKGCCSWTEFCDKHLDRCDRAIRKALAEKKLPIVTKGTPSQGPAPEIPLPKNPELTAAITQHIDKARELTNLSQNIDVSRESNTTLFAVMIHNLTELQAKDAIKRYGRS